MPTKSMLALLPLYQRIRLELENYLVGWPLDTKIPTEQEIIDKFSISRVTARKALQSMREDGTLKSYPGRGTFLTRAITPKTELLKQSKLLGLLVPSVSEPMVSGIVRGVEAEATRRGYHVLLSHDHNDPEMQITQLGKMLDAQVDGILLYPDRFVTERKEFIDILKQLQNRNTPLVFLDRYIPNQKFPCVMTDNVQGMYQLTEHLIYCGRRRPALIGFWPSNTVHQDRRRGFIEALRDHGLSPKPILETETGADESFFKAAYDTVSSWVKGKKKDDLPFDSIVCMFDMLAYGAFTALQEAGLKVPDDIALAGYDNFDSEIYRALGLELTSVQQPRDEEGVVAVETLVDLIEGKQRSKRSLNQLLPPKLIPRTSCGEKLRVNA